VRSRRRRWISSTGWRGSARHSGCAGCPLTRSAPERPAGAGRRAQKRISRWFRPRRSTSPRYAVRCWCFRPTSPTNFWSIDGFVDVANGSSGYIPPGLRELRTRQVAARRLPGRVVPLAIPDGGPPLRWRPGDSRTFLFLGALSPHKRADLMLDAWRRVAAETSADGRLLVAGDGALRDQPAAVTPEVPSVQPLGFLHAAGKEVAPATGRVAGIPEPVCGRFPISCVESLRAERPIIASTIARPPLASDGTLRTFEGRDGLAETFLRALHPSPWSWPSGTTRSTTSTASCGSAASSTSPPPGTTEWRACHWSATSDDLEYLVKLTECDVVIIADVGFPESRWLRANMAPGTCSAAADRPLRKAGRDSTTTTSRTGRSGSTSRLCCAQ